VAIVLVRPIRGENVGAAARVAWNMGISRLVVVRDSLPEREEMAKMATHKASHLIDGIELYPTVAEALAEFSLVVGTTARRGRHRLATQGPREMASELLPFLDHNKVAILFGPEDTGLTNDDLKFCRFASAIPTAEFSSLNLAQAVAIHCYELYYAVVHAPKNMRLSPQLATSYELESMYSSVETALATLFSIEATTRADWLYHLRRLFSRMVLTSREASTVRSICNKLLLEKKTPSS
jgi:tRNA/rRNA methyltransferase